MRYVYRTRVNEAPSSERRAKGVTDLVLVPVSEHLGVEFLISRTGFRDLRGLLYGLH